jgi:hypothetical protein
MDISAKLIMGASAETDQFMTRTHEAWGLSDNAATPTRPHIRLPGSTSNVTRHVRVPRSSTVPSAAIALSKAGGL